MRVFISPTELELKEENVISIKRISKATTGGRSMRFNCIVAVDGVDKCLTEMKYNLNKPLKSLEKEKKQVLH